MCIGKTHKKGKTSSGLHPPKILELPDDFPIVEEERAQRYCLQEPDRSRKQFRGVRGSTRNASMPELH
jgi:hypothetical protein